MISSSNINTNNNNNNSNQEVNNNTSNKNSIIEYKGEEALNYLNKIDLKENDFVFTNLEQINNEN